MKKTTKKFTAKDAELVFKRYAALLYRIFVEEKQKFDLIIAPGDSGAVMSKFLEFILDDLGASHAPIIKIPIRRFTQTNVAAGKYFDNKKLLPMLKKQLISLKVKNLKRVLFIDDEIMTAYSAKTCIEFVMQAWSQKMPQRIDYTIIAENHGFEWHYDLPPVAIKYYAFARKTPGVNGAIFGLFSDSVFKQFVKVDPKVSKRLAIQSLSVGYSKDLVNDTPVYDDRLVKKFTEIKNFGQHQVNLVEKIKQLAAQGIVEYIAGQIKFIY